MEALKKEIQLNAKRFSGGRIFDTIYFGGGTPSLIEAFDLNEIKSIIKDNFDIAADCEFTIETNPGTVDKKKLDEFLKIGVNRLSVGVQSFFDKDIKYLDRIHDSLQAVQTIYKAKEAGFVNIGVDLIFNLPGQTSDEWKENLQKVLELPIKHISAYSLIVERGTVLNKMVKEGKTKIADADCEAELFELTMNFLEERSFIQYEISNYAKQGYECRHNIHYWNYDEYISFGPSAHSFVDGRRFKNISGLNFYLSLIDEKGSAVIFEEELTKEQMINEYIMLAFRSRGFDADEFQRRFGFDWSAEKRKILDALIISGALVENNRLFKLTKKGTLICDEIILNMI